MWSLTTVLTIALLWMTLSAAIGGAVRAGGAIAAGTATAVGGAADGPDISLEALGLSTEDFLAPINRRLQAEGKPPVTGDQLNAAARAAMRTSIRQGHIDRELIVIELSRNTDLSREEAAEVTTSIERRYGAAGGDLVADVRTHALSAAEGAGKALLGLSLAMLLGLVAAVGGAVIAVHNARKRAYPGTAQRTRSV